MLTVHDLPFDFVSVVANIIVIVIHMNSNRECMRGDLHTLKRVCRYASVVMLAGEIAFIALTAAVLVMGAWSMSDPSIRESFSNLIICKGTDLSLVSGTVELAVLFVAMFVTVKIIHDVMMSIQREHSPFIMENADRLKMVSLTFLVASAPLAVLEYLCRSNDILAVCIFLACILICVVLYCLTIVFRYGCMLQNESDHTL